MESQLLEFETPETFALSFVSYTQSSVHTHFVHRSYDWGDAYFLKSLQKGTNLIKPCQNWSGTITQHSSKALRLSFLICIFLKTVGSAETRILVFVGWFGLDSLASVVVLWPLFLIPWTWSPWRHCLHREGIPSPLMQSTFQARVPKTQKYSPSLHGLPYSASSRWRFRRILWTFSGGFAGSGDIIWCHLHYVPSVTWEPCVPMSWNG